MERLEGGEGALLQKTRGEVIKRMWEGGVGKRRSVEERLHTVPQGGGGVREDLHEVYGVERHAGESEPTEL